MYRVRIMEMSVRAGQVTAMGLGRPVLADLEPWVGSEPLRMRYQPAVEFLLIIRIRMDIISIPLRAQEGMGWEGILDKVRWRMEGRI